jgi:hypothetical protein
MQNTGIFRVQKYGFQMEMGVVRSWGKVFEKADLR